MSNRWLDCPQTTRRIRGEAHFIFRAQARYNPSEKAHSTLKAIL